MLFKLSNLNSNLALTLGYLNPAGNNSAQKYFGTIVSILLNNTRKVENCVIFLSNFPLPFSSSSTPAYEEDGKKDTEKVDTLHTFNLDTPW